MLTDVNPVQITETLTVTIPDRFYGNRKELEKFLLQVEMYFRFNSDKFATAESYSLKAASYLGGEAEKWIQSYLKDYFNSTSALNCMQKTQVIFSDFGGFKKKIRRAFGDIDGVKKAERNLSTLRQTGSAINYAT